MAPYHEFLVVGVDEAGDRDPIGIDRLPAEKVCHPRVAEPDQAVLDDHDDLVGVLNEYSVFILALLSCLLGLPEVGGFPDLLRKLCKPGPRVPAFLEVEVGTVFECLDDDLFTAFAGEDDERRLFSMFSQVLEKPDPVAFGHHVV